MKTIFFSRSGMRTVRVLVASAIAVAAHGYTTISAQSSPATAAARFVDSARVEIDRAVIASDTARLTRAIVLLDRALVAFPNDPYLQHYRGYANYRRVLDHFRSGDMHGGAPFIAAGIADLEKSVEKLPWAETYSLLSAMAAFRIAVDPSLAPTVGMEIGALMGKAMQIGANNPRVLLLQAYGAQKTPVEYGGGMDVAKPLLTRALAAFATYKPAPLAPAWGLEEAQALQKQWTGGGE